MNGRPSPILACAVLAIALLIVAAAAVAAPSATAAGITVTAPAGTATYYNGDQLKVSWTLGAPVRGGYFCVYVCGGDGTLWQSKSVASTRDTAYSTTLTIEAEPASGYYVLVKYRPNRNADFTMIAQSPGTFTIASRGIPFQTNAWQSQETVVRLAAFTFRFWVLHPVADTEIRSGEIVVVSARSGVEVKRISLVGVDYVITTTWDDTPPIVFDWASCTLDPGDYLWHVHVTTIAGETNVYAMEGALKVTRR